MYLAALGVPMQIMRKRFEAMGFSKCSGLRETFHFLLVSFFLSSLPHQQSPKPDEWLCYQLLVDTVY